MRAGSGDPIPTKVKERRADPRRWEEELAADIGGRRLFLSGAGFEKGDVRRAAGFRKGAGGVERTEALALRAEAKLTEQPSYAFRTVDWWDIARSAAGGGEEPLLAVRFSRARETIVVLRVRLAADLGLLQDEAELPVVTVAKSCRLRPHTHQLLRVARPSLGAAAPRQEALLAAPYEAFLARLRAHEAGATGRTG